MSKVLFTILAVCLVQVAYGRVAREEPTTVNPFYALVQNAIDMANSTFNELNKAVLDFNGVQNNEQLYNKTKANVNTFAESLRSQISSINEETKPIQGKADELFKTFIAKGNEIVENLKSKNPEIFSGDLKKLQSVGENALRTIADESEKLRSRLQAAGHEITPQIEQNLKKINEAVIKSAQDFKTQAESTLNSISKKN
ncbi:uncharacterized protein LOC116337255 [Contarinia nasturtii]|uniref:uncharacterized protein LOC116337255 n=1 Tax=Contarinia nasturtii TaxID=265458 RepID=UPI0012D3A738|nr:uncharacterized protein LOC116337255 [Contarinia nasturtii]